MRPSLKLRVLEKMVVPPRSHARVRVTCEGYAGLDDQTEIHVIAPRRVSKRRDAGLRAAWGVCLKPEWVQVANFTGEAQVLTTGAVVAELHTIEGLARRLKIDPELEALEKEQKERKIARNVELNHLTVMLFALRVGGDIPTRADQGSKKDSVEGMATLPESLASDKAVYSLKTSPRGVKSPNGAVKRQRERDIIIDKTTQGGSHTQHINTKTLKTSQHSTAAGAGEALANTPQEAIRCGDAVMPKRLKANTSKTRMH